MVILQSDVCLCLCPVHWASDVTSTATARNSIELAGYRNSNLKLAQACANQCEDPFNMRQVDEGNAMMNSHHLQMENGRIPPGGSNCLMNNRWGVLATSMVYYGLPTHTPPQHGRKRINKKKNNTT